MIQYAIQWQKHSGDWVTFHRIWTDLAEVHEAIDAATAWGNRPRRVAVREVTPWAPYDGPTSDADQLGLFE